MSNRPTPHGVGMRLAYCGSRIYTLADWFSSGLSDFGFMQSFLQLQFGLVSRENEKNLEFGIFWVELQHPIDELYSERQSENYKAGFKLDSSWIQSNYLTSCLDCRWRRPVHHLGIKYEQDLS
jgi:hypothetical protein